MESQLFYYNLNMQFEDCDKSVIEYTGL